MSGSAPVALSVLTISIHYIFPDVFWGETVTTIVISTVTISPTINLHYRGQRTSHDAIQMKDQSTNTSRPINEHIISFHHIHTLIFPDMLGGETVTCLSTVDCNYTAKYILALLLTEDILLCNRDEILKNKYEWTLVHTNEKLHY